MDLTGKLLIALPVLVDPNFDRTVVLLLSHGDQGAVGVVLNRPSTIALGDPLPSWTDLAAAPAVVFVGGPVEPDRAIALGRDGDGVGAVDLDGDPMIAGVPEIRVFAGYAGWSADQLEGEIAEGAWAVCESSTDDVFRHDADGLWYAVLARQPDPLRRLARLPEDPSVN